jgi:hypothetical protein
MSMISTFPTSKARQYTLTLIALAVLVLGTSVTLARQAGAIPASIPLPQWGQLPLSFEPNVGQTAPAVQFQVRAPGGTLGFLPTEVALALPAAAGATTATSQLIRLQFLGANSATTITGHDELPGKANYLRGQDPAQWKTNVPTYAGVTYTSLYNGINLAYAGTAGVLKGTYTVAAGADATAIRWRYAGASQVQVDAAGNLQITVAGAAGQAAHAITEQAPVAWQEIAGARVPVAARYAVAADGAIAFALGAYDRSQALTIDPTLTFGSFLGGSLDEYGYGLGVDAAGNVYVAGQTASTDFPLVDQLYTDSADNDAFVTKINAAGTAVVYSTYLGGNGSDWAEDLAVDPAGNAYTTGRTGSADFPTTANAVQATSGGSTDAFMSKLAPDGATLLYSTFLGGVDVETGRSIAVDASGMAYVSGTTSGANFPVKNAYQATFGGEMDFFVAKLNTQASGDASKLYATYLGGSGLEYARNFEAGGRIAIDAAGNLYLADETYSANYPTSPGALQSAYSAGGNADTVITKLNSAGALVASTYLGRAGGSEHGRGVAVDGAGNIYVTGYGAADSFPTTAGAYKACGGGNDFFVAKLNPTLSDIVWATCVAYGSPYRLVVDSANNVYAAGVTRSTTFPLVNAIQTAFQGFEDAFVVKLNPAGTAILFSTYLGGHESPSGQNAHSAAYDLALDAANPPNIYVTGSTDTSDFPVAQPFQPYAGGRDAFVVKIDQSTAGPPPCTLEFTDVPNGSTFYPYIRCLACRNIVGGYDNGDGTLSFRPGNNVTRGQVAKFVANAAGYTDDIPATRQSFTDVPATSPFWLFIERAYAHGVISGYDNGDGTFSFRPNANVTRGQMSKFVANAANYTEDIPATQQTFQDVPHSNPFWLFTERAYAHGVISGYNCGATGEPCPGLYFRPNANVTRGQTSKFISNAFFPNCQTPR